MHSRSINRVEVVKDVMYKHFINKTVVLIDNEWYSRYINEDKVLICIEHVMYCKTTMHINHVIYSRQINEIKEFIKHVMHLQHNDKAQGTCTC